MGFSLLFGGPGGLAPLASGPRLAGSRLPSGLRRTALAVAGGACIWRSPFSLTLKCGPTRQTPHHLEPAGLFSVPLLVTKEEQPPAGCRSLSAPSGTFLVLFWSQKSTKAAAGSRSLSAPCCPFPGSSFGHKRGTTPPKAAVPGAAGCTSTTCAAPSAARNRTVSPAKSSADTRSGSF